MSGWSNQTKLPQLAMSKKAVLPAPLSFQPDDFDQQSSHVVSRYTACLIYHTLLISDPFHPPTNKYAAENLKPGFFHTTEHLLKLTLCA